VAGWLLRLAVPMVAELGSMDMHLSNAKAKRELGWSLQYPTVKEGVAHLARTLAGAA